MRYFHRQPQIVAIIIIIFYLQRHTMAKLIDCTCLLELDNECLTAREEVGTERRRGPSCSSHNTHHYHHRHHHLHHHQKLLQFTNSVIFLSQ